MKNKEQNYEVSKINQQDSQENNTPKDELSIYNLIDNVKKENEKMNIKKNRQKNALNNYLEFLSTIMLSVILYVICISIAQIPLVEVIDLELPLIIIFTIVLTKITQKSEIIPYGIFFVIMCVVFMFNPSYAFFLAMSLVSVMIVRCIEKIHTNEYDYRV